MPLHFIREDEIYNATTVTKGMKITTKPCGTTVLHVHNESNQLLCMQQQTVVCCCCDFTCACRYTRASFVFSYFSSKPIQTFRTAWSVKRLETSALCSSHMPQCHRSAHA
jgi:hypothetical protein